MQPGLPPVSDMLPPAGHDPNPVAAAAARPPRDFVYWSVFNLVFMNYFFLGFGAFIFSIKSRDCKVMGDPEGAKVHGKKAKYLNLVASIVGFVCHTSFFILIANFPPPLFKRAVRGILQRYLGEQAG